MNSRIAVRQHSTAPRKNLTPAATVRSAIRTESAANDEQPKSDFAPSSDPLFGMAMATVILFAVLAALIAFS
jgi:hypothetical protein